MSLTPQSLADAMENSSGVDYKALFPAVNQCLLECDCTTVERSAMWFGQVGEESGGLRWMEEIASGSEYEGRTELGNTHPGDGARYKGRGPIQVTGRHNYTVLSQWAFSKGLVPSPTFFVDQPAQLASDQYGFMGVTWYWTTQRPMNDAADAKDIVRATKYVNGGTHGLDDRTQRWQHALAMGDAILPSGSAPKPVAPPRFNEINQLGVNGNFGNRSKWSPSKIDLLLIHTQEADNDAQGLADFLKSTEGTNNPRSYHYTIDNFVTVIDVGDTDYGSYSVGNSNGRSINYCFAGSYASWTRQDWLNKMGNGIDVCAYLIVQDARKYGIDPTKVIAPPYSSNPPGVSDHRYCGTWLHDGNNHTDVGDQFPWDVLIERINHYAGNTTGDDDVPLVSQPSGSIYRESNDNLPWQGTPMDFIIDAANHEARVERLAEQGFPKALALIQAVADGTSPVSDSLSEENVQHAQSVLDYIATQSKKDAD